MRSIEWIESRILAGRREEAWCAVESALGAKTDLASRERLLVDATYLALHYAGGHRIEAWLEAFREPDPLDPVVEAIAAAIQVTVAWSEREDRRAFALADRVPWELLASRPWARTLRFCLLSQRGDDPAALECLESVEPEAGEYERASRELFLLTHHAARGHARDAIAVAFRALERLRPLPGLRARIREVQVLAELGSILGRSGRSAEAIRAFERVFLLAHQLGLATVERMYCEELAQLYAEAGRFEDAYDVLGRAPLDAESALPRDLLQRVRRHLCHAEIYADEEDPGHGIAHVAAALDLLRGCHHARLEAHARLALGRLLGLVPRRIALAEEKLAEAERRFRWLGEEGHHGLTCTLTARGEVLLALKRAPEALACFHESVAIASGLENLPAKSRCVLLKSRLLLEDALERPQRAYEELLAEIGHVRGRTDRLRALANLLAFSWRLQHGAEIGRQHHLEICRLEPHIDGPVFRRLYNRHVRDRFANERGR